MATEPIENGESMASVRAKLNAVILAMDRVGAPVDTFADLPASPQPSESHWVYSLNYPLWWDDDAEAWKNSYGVVITAAEEGE